MSDSTPLDVILDLALARTLLVREIDRSMSSSHGLSLSDFALLLELHNAPGGKLRRVELAERLGVTPSGVARQLLPLERIGVVSRETHESDARLALVVLTEAGERSVTELLPIGNRAAERSLDKRWSAKEQKALGELVSALRVIG